jgi:hypothetical protein
VPAVCVPDAQVATQAVASLQFAYRRADAPPANPPPILPSQVHVYCAEAVTPATAGQVAEQVSPDVMQVPPFRHGFG